MAESAETPVSLTEAPDYLVIGHVTKDVTPDGGYVLGGTVSFSSLTAQRLGRRAAVLTRCERLPDLREYLETQGVALHRVPADVTTTFENVYKDGHRTQDRKSTRLNSSHSQISYAVFCLKKKKKKKKKKRKT